MTTDDDYPRRKVRPELARIGPKRGLDAFTPPPVQPHAPSPSPTPTSPHTHADTHAEISKLVSDAVREGYDVINENLRQGRAAADAHSRNKYRLEDATQDLSKLSKRMMGLSRELGTTLFDLLAAVVRDPMLHAALQGSKTHDGPTDNPHQPTPPVPTPVGPVPILVEFTGSPNSTGTATPLPPQVKPPFPKVTALDPVNPTDARSPLTRVGFGKTPQGGLRVVVDIPAGQSPGSYEGQIVDRASGVTLSVLTVEVRA